MKYPKRLKKDVFATYIEDIDCTVVWQDLWLEEERHGQPDLEMEPVQRVILGWYFGKPNKAETEHYSMSTTVAQYY